MTTLNGWRLDAESIPRLSNCRLTKTQKLLNQLLMAIEHEIEQRGGPK
jgi:hypothetical protein